MSQIGENKEFKTKKTKNTGKKKINCIAGCLDCHILRVVATMV